MGSLIDIRRRIKSTKNTQQITKAMKMVSASRLRRASERATEARPYADRIHEVHSSILARLGEVSGSLYSSGEGPKTLLVVVAGDKGLCGSFNTNIFKTVDLWLRRADNPDDIVILPIGKKSVGRYRKGPQEVLSGYEGIFRDLTVAFGEELSSRLIELFQEHQFARVMVIYNKFKNVLVQEVQEEQLLPLSAKIVKDDESEPGPEHLAEPSLESILEELSPRLVMTRIYQALLESNAAEHAARMTAMDAATNNAKDLIESLTLEMNKARQAAITKELIEVVSGAAAL